ncbi:hypothetical protein CDL15_Pgr008455 [Punica granatum]|uniref:Uncharacterized protein n=1 Tax=Punica granatum TaxID=22663 RepID=A0A218WMS5_PUNGR|nr:hypothetical protein CDL15_Pgr008455 [Punica granatum]
MLKSSNLFIIYRTWNPAGSQWTSSSHLYPHSPPKLVDFSDHIHTAVASHCHDKLARLPFLAGPLRNLTLLSPLSRKFAHGTTLIVSLLRPLLFTWVLNFPSPEEVPVLATSSDGVKAHIGGGSKYDLLGTPGPNQGLRASSLSGTRGSDWGSVDYGGAARRLLATLGHLRELRKLDLTYNEMLLNRAGHLGACLLWLPGRFEAERLGTTRFLILRGMEWPRVQNSTSLGGKWGLWVTAGAH